MLERPVFKSWVLPRTGPRGAEWRLLARLNMPDSPPPKAIVQQEEKI